MPRPSRQNSPKGREVTVVSASHPRVVVRDAAGREFDIHLDQLDSGFDYRDRASNWHPEIDPRVIKHLREELAAKLAKTDVMECILNDHLASIERLRETIRRNTMPASCQAQVTLPPASHLSARYARPTATIR